MVNEHGYAYEPHPNLRIDLVKAGWRPAIGWVSVLIILGVGVRIVLGLPLPDLSGLITALMPAITVALTRTLEKKMGVA